MQTLLQQKTFLIVDDFGDMRSMLRSMLNLVPTPPSALRLPC